MSAEVLHQTIPLPRHYRFAATLRVLSIGRYDPSCKVTNQQLVRASRTPDGPVTLVIDNHVDHAEATAYGPGAQWQLDRTPDLLGLWDEHAEIPRGVHPVVDQAMKKRPRPRFVREHMVIRPLVPIVLGQKVTGQEAARSYQRMTRYFFEPAPGPFADLSLPPAPEAIAGAGADEMQSFGILRPQAHALKELCRRHKRLERLGDEDDPGLRELLPKFRGVGPWTVSSLYSQSRGDADAVIVGDFHLPHAVVHAFTGRPRGTDEEMLDLLAPFAGQRARVVRLVFSYAGHEPRFGPRAPLREQPATGVPLRRRR